LFAGFEALADTVVEKSGGIIGRDPGVFHVKKSDFSKGGEVSEDQFGAVSGLFFLVLIW
jgi:hypothetical protein